MPGRGLVRGGARFRSVPLGAPGVKRFRADIADPSSATDVHMFLDCSLVPVLYLKRRLEAVHGLLGCIGCDRFALSRGLELNTQWGCIQRHAPSDPSTWDDFDAGAHSGPDVIAQRIAGSVAKLSKFIHEMVDFRRDFAIRSWSTWVLEDPPVHPYKWLRPDLVLPYLFLSLRSWPHS